MRHRYVWDETSSKLIEVECPWTPTLTRVPVIGDSHYDGLRAPDGTDISSRHKHRAYLKATGYTTADDYTQEWARAAEERARPGVRDPERRHDIGRAIYELEKLGRNKKERK